MYSNSTNSITTQKNDNITAAFALPHARNVITTDPSIALEHLKQIPHDAYPITCNSPGMYTINRDHTYSQPTKRIIRTWKEHINSLPNYEKSLLKNTNIISNNIDADINETDLIVSRNGSYKTKKSGGAFIIAKENGKILVTGSNSDTGHPDYQQAYRSEAQAKLAGHICLQ